MKNNSDGYAKYLSIRQRLADSIEKVARSIGRLGADARAKNLLDAKSNLECNTFRLMIAGEFKRGKSTLINAMLGRDVLPAKVAPCTAVITRVTFGEKPDVVLHYKDVTKVALHVPLEELKKYVCIDDENVAEDEDQNSESVDACPYDKAEVFYPLQLCRNNVEIIDSPGLNEQKTRTKVTMEFLSGADAMVVVLSCGQALSQSELNFIVRDLKDRDLRHVFFVWNHFDLVADSPDDFDDIKKRSKKYLEPRVGTNQRIFYVSARTALIGRKNNRPEEVQRSGILEFEKELERFLTEDSGRIKMLAPLRTADCAIREAMNTIIPTKEAMLSQPLAELSARYEEQRPRLQDVELQRERLLRSIERHRDVLIRETESSYQNLVLEIEVLVKSRLAGADVGFFEAIKAKRSELKQKLTTLIQVPLNERISKWQDDELTKLLQKHFDELKADLDGQSRTFLDTLDSVRKALTPDLVLQETKTEEEISGINRLLGTVGGLFVGGIGSAIEGGTGGVAAMVKGLPVQIAVGVGLVVMGFGLPVILPALAAVGIFRTLIGGKSKIEQVKEETGDAIIAKLRQNTPEVLSNLRQLLDGQFQQIYKSIDTSTKIMIDEVTGQIEVILKERQAGEDSARIERNAIQQVREELAAEAKHLDALRSEADLT